MLERWCSLIVKSKIVCRDAGYFDACTHQSDVITNRNYNYAVCIFGLKLLNIEIPI